MKKQDVMKKQKNTTWMKIHLILLSVLLLAACSSDDNAMDTPLLGESKFTMKVNGELWTAEWAFTQTYYDTPEDEEFEDEMVGLIISAYKDMDQEEDTVGENLTIVIGINRANFNNPIGSYPINYNDMSTEGFSYITYYNSIDEIAYISYNIEEDKESAGEVTITGFEIGEQFLLGKGYVKLSGNFSADMYGYFTNESEVDKIEIRSGEFNITSNYLGM